MFRGSVDGQKSTFRARHFAYEIIQNLFEGTFSLDVSRIFISCVLGLIVEYLLIKGMFVSLIMYINGEETTCYEI